MPIGLGTALWAVVLPVDETNLFTNPSFEFGNAGAVAIQSATLGTSSAFQRYGAWSLSVTPNSNGTSGVLLGTITTGNGTTYSAGAWVLAANGVPMRMGLGDNAGLNLTSGTVTFTGGGTWQWYNCAALTEAAQGTRGLVVQKTSGNSVAPFYVDGVDISPWTDGIGRTTTYVDGDQPGGTWLGPQHASQSFRTGQYRGGGSIVALADLGLQVDQMIGVGVPPVENSSQSYAVIDGAQYQRTRAASRQFTLTAKPIVGTSLGDFHITRRTLWDALKPDLVTPQQPVRLLYYGAQGTQQLDAYYASGLELGNMTGPIAEDAGISFAAYDPYWYAPTQQGTTLAPRFSLGSANFIVKRSPQGKWGTLGAAGSTVQYNLNSQEVRALAINPAGTVFLGGMWGTLAGTVNPSVGMYYPASNTFGTLNTGTVGIGGIPGTVYALALSPSGTLYIGGRFSIVGGTTIQSIAQWTGANFGSLVGGTLSAANVDYVRALEYSGNGSLWMGGSISTLNGTTARAVGFWSNGASGTAGSIGGGAVTAFALAQGADGRMFIGGNFTGVAGNIGSYIAYYKDGALGTLSGGTLGDVVEALATAPNGVEYIGGHFTVPDLYTTAWNGVAYTGQGNGLNNRVWGLLSNAIDNSVIAAGEFTAATDNPLLGCIGQWNGNIWTSYDIDLANIGGFSQGTAFAIAQAPDNTIYVAGRFFGSAMAASVGTVINTGRALAYPMLRLRNTSGTANIYQLLNVTTGDIIYFNYKMQPGETALLNLTPANRSFRSDFQGNVLGKILPSSDFATWGLLPGANLVSFFSDNDTLDASFFWQSRGWAADSGTI